MRVEYADALVDPIKAQILAVLDPAPTMCPTSRAIRSSGGFGSSTSAGKRRSRDDQYLSVPTTRPWTRITHDNQRPPPSPHLRI